MYCDRRSDRRRERQNEYDTLVRDAHQARNRLRNTPNNRQSVDAGATPSNYSHAGCRERETKRRRADKSVVTQVGSSSQKHTSVHPSSPLPSSRMSPTATASDRHLSERGGQHFDSQRLVDRHALAYEAEGSRYDRERGLHATNRDGAAPSGGIHQSYRRASTAGNPPAGRHESGGNQRRWMSRCSISPPHTRSGRRPRRDVRRNGVAQGEHRHLCANGSNGGARNERGARCADDRGDERALKRAPEGTIVLIPASWCKHKSSLQEWERLQAGLLERGDTANSLVFKLFHQLFLSPMSGVSFSSLSLIDKAFTCLPHFMFPSGNSIIVSSEFPDGVLSLLSHPLGALMSQCFVHSDQRIVIEPNSRSKDVEMDTAHGSIAHSAGKTDNFDVVELLTDNILYCFQYVIAPAHEAGCLEGRFEYLWRGSPQVKQEINALKRMDARRNVAVVLDPLYNHLMRALHRSYNAPTERHFGTSTRR